MDRRRRERYALVIVSLLIVAFTVLLVATLLDRGNVPSELEYIPVDGVVRSFYVYVPANISENPPLFIVLHGGGGDGLHMELKTTREGFDRLAEKYGFIVVYPNGVDGHWNDGREEVSGADDVSFMEALINYMRTEYRIGKVFVVGMSNGGMFAYRLACEIPEEIDGIAAVAASMPERLYETCRPSEPVSILVIHGTDDPIVPWDGGEVKVFGESRGTVVSIGETISFWTGLWNCTLAEDILLPDRDPDDGTRVRLKRYMCPAYGVEVVLYAVEGGGHTWPDGGRSLPSFIVGRMSHDLDAVEAVFDFAYDTGILG